MLQVRRDRQGHTIRHEPRRRMRDQVQEDRRRRGVLAGPKLAASVHPLPWRMAHGPRQLRCWCRVCLEAQYSLCDTFYVDR